MNALLEDVLLLVVEYGFLEIAHLIVVAVLRPSALFFGFLLTTWTMSHNRIGVSVTAAFLGLPMVLSNLLGIHKVIEETEIFGIILIAVSEVIIGFGIGLIASLPFLAAQYAGSYIDQFRGETDSGLHGPEQTMITTYGLIFLLIAFMAFVSADGILFLIRALYHTYAIFPFGSLVPDFDGRTLEILLMLLRDTLILSIRVAGPLLGILFIVECILIIAARIAKKYNAYNLAFASKNLCATVLLPLIAHLFWRVQEYEVIPMLLQFSLLDWFSR